MTVVGVAGKPTSEQRRWVVGGLLMFETIAFLSKQVVFFPKKWVFLLKKTNPYWKWKKKSTWRAKISRKIAKFWWISVIFLRHFDNYHAHRDSGPRGVNQSAEARRIEPKARWVETRKTPGFIRHWDYLWFKIGLRPLPWTFLMKRRSVLPICCFRIPREYELELELILSR